MRRLTDLVLTALLLLTLSTATNASAQVCASLNLTTQAEDAAVSCSSVTGDVTVSSSESDSITNVDGLGGITSIGGEPPRPAQLPSPPWTPPLE